jgi:hypothetical protein
LYLTNRSLRFVCLPYGANCLLQLAATAATTAVVYYCTQFLLYFIANKCRLFEKKILLILRERRMFEKESRFSHEINHAYKEEDAKGVEKENVCISEDVM